MKRKFSNVKILRRCIDIKLLVDMSSTHRDDDLRRFQFLTRREETRGGTCLSPLGWIRLINDAVFEPSCLRTYFSAEKSVRTASIWPFVSPRKYATMPSFVRAVYRRCLPNKSLYRSLCLCVPALCARGTNPPPNDTPSWERNYGMPLRCAIQRGIKLAVMVMQSIWGKHVQAEGGASPLETPS